MQCGALEQTRGKSMTNRRGFIMCRTVLNSRSRTKCVGILLLAAPLLAPTLAAAQQQQISIGFIDRVADAEVVQMLENQNATPVKAYIWSSGFSGSHSEALAATRGNGGEEFVNRARQETINFFEKALEGNTYRLERMLESRDRQDAIYDQEFNQNLRSVLTLRSQFESVLEEARSGGAFIYAVDVEVASGDAAALRAHPTVRVSVMNGEGAAAGQITQGLKPVEFGNEFEDREIRLLSNEELYTRALSTLTN